MEYIELKINVLPEYVDILVAELVDLHYEGFVETDKGVDAYVPVNLFDTTALEELGQKYQELFKMNYNSTTLEKQNWNETWEKNYDPVMVNDQCIIRTTFHQIDKKFPYEIIINPKMSFGTGHHATTTLMIEHQLTMDFQQKQVLDMGCGTGILAIMAEKLGATTIDAVDIDDWSVENSIENVGLNHCQKIKLQKGTVDTANLKEKYDIILANINRNVLVHDMPYYHQHLTDKGFLVVSGFYEADVKLMENTARKYNLEAINYKTKDSWSSIIFKKHIS
ncbi:50S ribosomal protein L11 methyltransferase [uncultured Microscilla sp.]|uniref:50S ribosomal protein L11 methyltransferase n=1 Tax=uncultured Microscilla sp. TaxID=432653 RepID=UPI00262252D9|nr:50S ribosomal protein L11 methyltransferase [uncultured Microscilla sp.]